MYFHSVLLGYSYCWHEGLAKRGAMKFYHLFLSFENVGDGKIIFMFDTCDLNIAVLVITLCANLGDLLYS
jgi:hypothetical protein